MIKAGIIGATGYAGGELVRILANHRDVKVVWYGSHSYIDQRYSDVYRNMFRVVEDVCRDDNLAELAKEADVIFAATPQGFLAGLLTEDLLSKTKIVDLLMRNPGRIFPAEEIYRRVWEEESFASENTVMVHIRRIREKIELNPKEPEYLKVVWGIGYKMEKM